MNLELLDLLEPAYKPCAGLKQNCRDKMQWDPENGHIPRGYFGATGTLAEVELVLVLAEPGKPLVGESYETDSPRGYLHQHNRKILTLGRNIFHKNLRCIISLCFPEVGFEDSLRKVWITESVLCSTPASVSTTGAIPISAVRECGERYLKKQRELLGHAYWVAIGNKANQRLLLNGIIPDCQVSHPAPPEGHKKRAIYSWREMARKFHEKSDN